MYMSNFVKIVLKLILFWGCSLYASLPEEFYLKQRWYSFVFDIESTDQKLGTVERKLWNLLPEYHYYNANQKFEAKASMRWLSWGSIFDITNAKGGTLGRVDERIFTFYVIFDIFSPSNEHLAKATMNFWGTQFSWEDPITHKLILTATRPFVSFKDQWTIHIKDSKALTQKQLHPALILTVLTFQTDVDERRNRDKNIHYTLQFERDTYNLLLEVTREQLAHVEAEEEDFQWVAHCVETTAPTQDSQGYLEQLQTLLLLEDLPLTRKKAAHRLLESVLNR